MKYTTTKYTSDIKDVDNMDGFEFEEFCCELLRHNGYKNVRRTQASGDYGLDVIATTSDGFVCGIQCKNYQSSVGIAAVQEAKTGSDYYNCDIAIVLTNRTFTKSAIELAKRINVKLWGRNKLIKLIKVFPEKENLKKESLKKEYETYVSNTQNIKHIEDIDKMNSQIQFHKFCCDLLEYNKFTVTGKEVYFNDDMYIIAFKENIRYQIKCFLRFNLSNAITCENIEKIVSVQNWKKIDMPNLFSQSFTVILSNGFFAREAIERAEKNNIKIWDRNRLITLLKPFPTIEVETTDIPNDFSQKEITIQNNITDVKSDINEPIQTGESDGKDWIWGCLGLLIVLVITGFITWKFFKWIAPVFAIILIGAFCANIKRK